jgi:hypothetical protein
VIKNILIGLLIVFMTYVSYDYGYKTAYNKQANTHIKQLEQEKLKQEELQKKIILIQKGKEDEIKAINSKHTAIVSSLRNRPERNEVSTSIGSRAGSTGEQLFREDAEFLIGEASKAMILRESLTSCRRYLLETNK